MCVPPIDEYVRRIHVAVAAESEKCGVSALNLRMDMAIVAGQFRNGLIRQRYQQMRLDGVKAEAIYSVLERDYGLSCSMVEKIVRDER